MVGCQTSIRRHRAFPTRFCPLPRRSGFPYAIKSVSDADVLIIVTAQPSVQTSVAATATCLQRDQYGRCTVGWFNWVPKFLNTEMPNARTVVSNELATAAHEFVRE